MCIHFEGILDPEVIGRVFGVALPRGITEPGLPTEPELPTEPGLPTEPHWPHETHIWPGSRALFIRRAAESVAPDKGMERGSTHRQADAGGTSGREIVPGQFGLVPHWAKDTKISRRTVNARSETAATKPAFRDPWRLGQRCIVPAAAIWEPDWRSGKARPTRIGRTDGQPLGLAGLWDAWTQPNGQHLFSFTLFTMNADDHALMRHFHRPSQEKRMVVILPEEAYEPWLLLSPHKSRSLIQAFPAHRMATISESPGSPSGPLFR